jgi:hypothetical protein
MSIFNDFHVPAFTPHLNSSGTSLQLSENIPLFAVCRMYTGVISKEAIIYIYCTVWGTGRNLVAPLRARKTACLKIQSVPHRKHSVSIKTTKQLLLFWATVAVYCSEHTERINALSGQNTEFLNAEAGGTYNLKWPNSDNSSCKAKMKRTGLHIRKAAPVCARRPLGYMTCEAALSRVTRNRR